MHFESIHNKLKIFLQYTDFRYDAKYFCDHLMVYTVQMKLTWRVSFVLSLPASDEL